jgi:hypothetical protein
MPKRPITAFNLKAQIYFKVTSLEHQEIRLDLSYSNQILTS